MKKKTCKKIIFAAAGIPLLFSLFSMPLFAAEEAVCVIEAAMPRGEAAEPKTE